MVGLTVTTLGLQLTHAVGGVLRYWLGLKKTKMVGPYWKLVKHALKRLTKSVFAGRRYY